VAKYNLEETYYHSHFRQFARKLNTEMALACTVTSPYGGQGYVVQGTKAREMFGVTVVMHHIPSYVKTCTITSCHISVQRDTYRKRVLCLLVTRRNQVSNQSLRNVLSERRRRVRSKSYLKRCESTHMDVHARCKS